MSARRHDAFERVRRVGLTLPDVEAVTRYDGSPVLKVGGAFMAGLATHPSAEPETLVVRADIEERAWLLEDAPDTYYLTDYYRRYPLVLARLSRIDRAALRDLLAISRRLTLPKARPRSKGAVRAILVWLAILGAGAGLLAAAQPRLSPLGESEWTEAQRAVAAPWREDEKGANDRRTYLQHPVLAANLVPFERYIASESTLGPRERELLILRTAWLCRSEYVWAHHAPAARVAGLGPADLTRIARGPDAAGWMPADATLLRAADELHVSAFVGDSTWRALSERYDVPHLMDLVFTVAEFTMVSGTTNSVRVQIEERFADRLPSDVPSLVGATRDTDRLIGKSARITPLAPGEWTPEVRQWLDPNGSGRPVAAIYRTYARHLAMDRPRTLVSEHIRQHSTLAPRVRELLIMRIGWLCRSEYEWAAHAPAGRRAGMSQADVDRVIAGPDARGGDPFEAVLLRAVDEMYRDDVVSDATWQALAARYDAKQLLDVLTTIGGYRMVSMALNTFGVQLEPNAERFPSQASR